MNEITTANSSALAMEIWDAWITGAAIPVPFSVREGGLDLNAAYAIEAEFRRRRAESGHKPVGRKVGFANRAMWRALKLETLVWASMYDDTVLTPPSEVSLARLIAPKLEPEIVFRLKRTLVLADLNGPAILAAVEWVALGFEIIDCPFAGWQFKPADFVAAYGLHRALIAGQPYYIQPDLIPALFDNLATFKLRLLKDGHLVEEGSGRNSLRNPALCLAELAGAVFRRTGSPLQAGEVVSTGTLTEAFPIAAGETWVAETDSLPVAKLVYHNLAGGS